MTRLKCSHRMSLPCDFISFSSIHVGGRGEGRGVLGKGGSAELGGRNQGPSPACVFSRRRGSASSSSLRPGMLVGSSPQRDEPIPRCCGSGAILHTSSH